MKFTQTTEASYLNIELDNGMRLTIGDGGSRHAPTITVRDPGGEVSPDMYDMGGTYEIRLPSAMEVGRRCDQYGADTEADDFPGEGTSTIEVIHRH
jgi:hypothetical protein